MKLIALCGAAGAGKDTVADMLPARKLAFADALYREVAEAWGVEQHVLRCRETKETPTALLALAMAQSESFHAAWKRTIGGDSLDPRSPRQILQWWGDYRRAQDPEYFVRRAEHEITTRWHLGEDTVLTDVRFPNEAALVRQLGGQLWQIRRPGYEAGGTGHASDTDGCEFRPDVVRENFGSLDDLRRTVLDAWEYRD
ncbi:MAG: hypothetical protein RSE32_14465 [Comamonas sp.]|uniref:hypothetical protein n=1 Tax=Comamonas sp. TaxID=34028 RepID=UPI002FC9F080